MIYLSSILYNIRYDGHGERKASIYLRNHLHKNVQKEWEYAPHESMHIIMERAFLLTDMDFCIQDESTSGATAVTCLIQQH